MTTIAIASDHRGYKTKQKLIAWLESQDLDIIDFGTSSDEKRVDAMDFSKKVCEYMKENKEAKGILICGNGVNMAITSNRHKHIRSSILYNKKQATEARIHNDINLAALGGEHFSIRKQKQMLTAFLETPVSTDPVYLKRIKRMS